MTNFHPITRLQKFRLLSLIPLYFMIVGLFLQPITEILPGLWTLIKEPDFLITDYFLVDSVVISRDRPGAVQFFRQRLIENLVDQGALSRS